MNNSSIIKVLIHSDDRTFSMEHRHKLKAYDMDVHFFNDKLNMLELIRSEEMDILVVNLNNSGHLDLSIVKAIRDVCSEIEIILLADTNDNIPSVDIMIEYNINGFHIKTNSQDNLLHQILSARKICLQKKTRP
ncbi:response regulator [Pseudobacteroides cellulosolvens]|uniref:Stage 0 sporulation protein A homolog n=1 Tax=Pseudobacteroides cellulosolvens ATCC 35603 = DSM 2933 TaxID=398512 RepID=A0A0L6JRI6_9FIRM|nr:response regulator [Pseudobacteroides cellulosolvens]KNY28393.1 response regulator receiver [Pseudobacteroides cellulosolvens ATCC 35603 = DSM 2933]